MKWFQLFVLLLLADNCVAQSAPEKLPTVERLCGKLKHSASVPTEQDKEWVLPGVTVRLYAVGGDDECCEGKAIIAKAITDRNGSFRLKGKNIRPGRYWVAANVNGREYKILFQYLARTDLEDPCDKTWGIENSGNFWVMQTIRLD